MKSLGDRLSYDLILIDAMNILMRNYYGMQLSYNGEHTGMLYGAVKLVSKLRRMNPQARIMWLFDDGHPRRSELLPEYKASRGEKTGPTPYELARVRDVLAHLGCSIVGHKGLEADDLAGYMTSGCEGRVLLVSNDADWVQFLRPGWAVMSSKGHEEEYSAVEKRLGFPPDKIVIYKVLRGDPSDGVRPAIPRMPEAVARVLVAAVEDWRGLKKLTDVGSLVQDDLFGIGGIPMATVSKWTDKIREGWEFVERTGAALEYHHDWIDLSSLAVFDGEVDLGYVIPVLESLGMNNSVEEVREIFDTYNVSAAEEVLWEE